MFDVTIAGEVNLDLILYGLNEEIPVDRELLASGFAMTLEARRQFSRTTFQCWERGWVLRRGWAMMRWAASPWSGWRRGE